ncbi:MAG: pilin [Clostridia bacterium]|nr:pilin [Clostridia bacterium]
MIRNNQKGFTLVELIIVIAVIGVLAAILIPVFSNVIDKSNAKSAYSDARNLTEQFLAEYVEEEMHIPDLVMFNVKGNKLYAFGYDREKGEVRPYKDNPIESYNDEEDLWSQADALLADFVSGGALTPDPEFNADKFSAADLQAFLIRYGWNCEEFCIHAGYLLQSINFFDSEEAGGAPVVPDEPVATPTPDVPGERTLTITPVFTPHATNTDRGTFTYTIPEGTGAEVTIVLDTTPIYNEIATDNYMFFMPGGNGASYYQINVVDNSGVEHEFATPTFTSEALLNYKGQQIGYSLPETAIPLITASTDFTAYLTEMYGSTSAETVANYRTEYRLAMDMVVGSGNRVQTKAELAEVEAEFIASSAATKTFAQYLREKYNIAANAELTYKSIGGAEYFYSDATLKNIYPNFYDADVGTGLAAGNTYEYNDVTLRHIEPEIQLMLLNYCYEQTVAFSFFKHSQGQGYVNDYNKFWSDVPSYDWGDDYSVPYYSLMDLISGNAALDFNSIFDKSGNTYTAYIGVTWHLGLATNAFQSTVILAPPTMNFSMKAK